MAPKAKPNALRSFIKHVRAWDPEKYRAADFAILEEFRDKYRGALQATLSKPLRGIVMESLEAREAKYEVVAAGIAASSRASISNATQSGDTTEAAASSSTAVLDKEDRDIYDIDAKAGGRLKEFMLEKTYLNVDKVSKKPITPEGYSKKFYDKERDREYSGKRIQEDIFEILDDIEEYHERRQQQGWAVYENDPVSLVWYTVCHQVCLISDQLNQSDPNSIITAMYRVTLIKNFLQNLRSVDFNFDPSQKDSVKKLISDLDTRLNDATDLLVRYYSQLCAKDYLNALHEQGAAAINNVFKWIACVPSDVEVPRGFSLKKCIELDSTGREIRNKAVRAYMKDTVLGGIITEFVRRPACIEFSYPYLFNALPDVQNFAQIESTGSATNDESASKRLVQQLKPNKDENSRKIGIHKDFTTELHLKNIVKVFTLTQHLMVATIIAREIMKFAAMAGNIGVYVIRRDEIKAFLEATQKIVTELQRAIEAVSRAIDGDYRALKDRGGADPEWYSAWTALDIKKEIMTAALGRILVPIRHLVQEIDNFSPEERLQQASAQIQYLDRLFRGMGITVTGPQLQPTQLIQTSSRLAIAESPRMSTVMQNPATPQTVTTKTLQTQAAAQSAAHAAPTLETEIGQSGFKSLFSNKNKSGESQHNNEQKPLAAVPSRAGGAAGQAGSPPTKEKQAKKNMLELEQLQKIERANDAASKVQVVWRKHRHSNLLLECANLFDNEQWNELSEITYKLLKEQPDQSCILANSDLPKSVNFSTAQLTQSIPLRLIAVFYHYFAEFGRVDKIESGEQLTRLSSAAKTFYDTIVAYNPRIQSEDFENKEEECRIDTILWNYMLPHLKQWKLVEGSVTSFLERFQMRSPHQKFIREGELADKLLAINASSGKPDLTLLKEAIESLPKDKGLLDWYEAASEKIYLVNWTLVALQKISYQDSPYQYVILTHNLSQALAEAVRANNNYGLKVSQLQESYQWGKELDQLLEIIDRLKVLIIVQDITR